MGHDFSHSQIDKLGERLKHGTATRDDLHFLDAYRRSFAQANESVIEAIRDQLRLKPNSRPEKTTYSIVAKLRRGSFRLSQIQDIAGCRIVVSGMYEQDDAVENLMRLFPRKTLDDKRSSPVFGYRAVHIIAQPALAATRDRLVEIQIRTELQQRWAELSEKYSDLIDPEIKYGGGNEEIRTDLDNLSQGIATVERAEEQIERLYEQDTNETLTAERRAELEELEGIATDHRILLERILDGLARLIPPRKEDS